MLTSLFKILEHVLSIWDSKEGKSNYEKYLKNKRAYDEEMDKRANGLKYSQLKCDRSLRNIEDIANATAAYIKKS